MIKIINKFTTKNMNTNCEAIITLNNTVIKFKAKIRDERLEK